MSRKQVVLKGTGVKSAPQPSRVPFCAFSFLVLLSLSLVPLRAQTAEPAPAIPAAPAAPAAPAPAPTGAPQDVKVPTVSDAEKKTVAAPDAQKENGNYGPSVKEIEVVYVGPKSVNKSVILSNMRTTVGQPYSPAAVEDDVKNLYATGLFVNLRISDEPLGDGVKVIVVVQPKPLVKEILINGYSAIKESRLRKEIKSKPGDPLSEQQIADDAQKIRDYYQSKGFNNIQVTYKIDVNEEFGRAVVSFTINEGAKAYITEVDFVGNKAFTDKELRKVFRKIRKKNFFSFINKSGLYKDDDFQEDLQKLRTFYQAHGYIDMDVKDTQLLYPEKGTMKVKITVFEGIQYRVGKIQIDGESLYTEAQIRGVLKMGEGAVFAPKGLKPTDPSLETDKKAIEDLYGKRGYIDAKVAPVRLPNVENAKIDLDYKITEGAQSFVDRIIIQGNSRTKDKVLRREIPLAPGDIYDSVRVEAAKKKLENMGYFEKVDISAQETSVPNRRNMVVTVEEKRTGSVTFGIGFSSVDSLLGFVELSQGNFDIANWPYFTGAGQKFRTRIQYGLVRKDFTLSFTEPWFLDKPLSVGFDLFAHQFGTDYQNSDFAEWDIGADLRVAKQLTPFWTASAMYKIEEISLYQFDDYVKQNLPGLYAERGNRSESSVTGSLTYDTRDSVFLTRRGEKVSFTITGAGGPLLGQTNIYKLQMDAQKFIHLPGDLIFSMNLSTGVANYYGSSNEVPLFERYFVGGSRSVRGFENRMVGPVYPGSDEPTGGDTYGYTNFELTGPIIDRVRWAVFYDAGFVEPDFGTYGDVLPDYNAAIGVGLRLNLPIGPLRFDYAIPVKSSPWNDNSGKFDFDVGYQF